MKTYAESQMLIDGNNRKIYIFSLTWKIGQLMICLSSHLEKLKIVTVQASTYVKSICVLISNFFTQFQPIFAPPQRCLQL